MVGTFFVVLYKQRSVYSLTFRSLCVSFPFLLFICAICESLYKQLVHSLHFLTDDTDEQNKQIFLLTTHRDLKVVELTELLDE